MTVEDATAPGWNCADGTPDEDHDWRYKSDWIGDPGVINGTMTYYYKVCRQCGKEDQCTGSEAAYADDFND